MADWSLDAKSLKKYPHLDPVISASEAEAYALDPARVAHHAFYPFIEYPNRWTKYAKKGARGKEKKRKIRYAARKDAYIYSRYRHLLSGRYEAQLQALGLCDSVLAYRRVLKAGGVGGKCNIDFAADAFSKIRSIGDCCVLCLDISGFFESLDHELLKIIWCRLIGLQRLPPDHYAVFRSITRYAVLDKNSLYESLGHIAEKKLERNSKTRKGYVTPYKEMPRKLCSGKFFRDDLLGEKELQIKVNKKPYGIPQGAPISDLLANIYMLDFDREVLEKVKRSSGYYFRYSDDIFIVVPGGAEVGKKWLEDMQITIGQYGEKLKIKPEKCSVVAYERDGDGQRFRMVHGAQGKNGVEYLGFRYDGKRVYLRDSTVSSLRRKVAQTARRAARRWVEKNAEVSLDDLKNTFDYNRVVKRYGKVENFYAHRSDVYSWTFWTYAKRSAAVFGALGTPILGQLRRHVSLVKYRCRAEIEAAYRRRSAAVAQSSGEVGEAQLPTTPPPA